jgi:hypothetical protein
MKGARIRIKLPLGGRGDKREYKLFCSIYLLEIDNYPSLPQDRLLALNYVGNRRIRMLGCGSRLKSAELMFPCSSVRYSQN